MLAHKLALLIQSRSCTENRDSVGSWRGSQNWQRIRWVRSIGRGFTLFLALHSQAHSAHLWRASDPAHAAEQLLGVNAEAAAP